LSVAKLITAFAYRIAALDSAMNKLV